MKTVGVVGIGDMGSGLALNLLAAGFEVVGVDLKPERMAAFAKMGGRAGTVPEIGAASFAVFVMVMTGDEAKDVILGTEGLVAHMASGSAVILSATIKPREAREIGAAMQGSGVHLIDTPVGPIDPDRYRVQLGGDWGLTSPSVAFIATILKRDLCLGDLLGDKDARDEQGGLHPGRRQGK